MHTRSSTISLTWSSSQNKVKMFKLLGFLVLVASVGNIKCYVIPIPGLHIDSNKLEFILADIDPGRPPCPPGFREIAKGTCDLPPKSEHIFNLLCPSTMRNVIGICMAI